MTYLRNRVCSRGSLSAVPFASACGAEAPVSPVLPLTSHPETPAVQSLRPWVPTCTCRVSTTVFSARFHFYVSLYGSLFTLQLESFCPPSNLQELSVHSKRNDAIVLRAQWSSTQPFPRLVLLLLSRLILCPVISRHRSASAWHLPTTQHPGRKRPQPLIPYF